jgi:hypothetical protein
MQNVSNCGNAMQPGRNLNNSAGLQARAMVWRAKRHSWITDPAKTAT